MRRIEPYAESVRQPWTRDEIRAAVRAVRGMAADEAAGLDTRQAAERVSALATELERTVATVRPRLGNIAAVLRHAGLPAPACLRDMPSVGRRIKSMILDSWHELDAAEDKASATEPTARRPWTADELKDAAAICRRMAAAEASLGRSLTLDEAGDAISEAAARLGRRWSDVRHTAAAAGILGDGRPACLADIVPAVLTETEKKALVRLLRGNGQG